MVQITNASYYTISNPAACTSKGERELRRQSRERSLSVLSMRHHYLLGAGAWLKVCEKLSFFPLHLDHRIFFLSGCLSRPRTTARITTGSLMLNAFAVASPSSARGTPADRVVDCILPCLDFLWGIRSRFISLCSGVV